MMEGHSACACLALGPRYSRTCSTNNVGVDESKGRFGSVDMDRCTQCGRLWLHYHVAYEGVRASGRWGTCQINENEAAVIKPDRATHYIDTHPHIFGGSFWGHAGRHGNGSLRWDL